MSVGCTGWRPTAAASTAVFCANAAASTSARCPGGSRHGVQRKMQLYWMNGSPPLMPGPEIAAMLRRAACDDCQPNAECSSIGWAACEQKGRGSDLCQPAGLCRMLLGAGRTNTR